MNVYINDIIPSDPCTIPLSNTFSPNCPDPLTHDLFLRIRGSSDS